VTNIPSSPAAVGVATEATGALAMEAAFGEAAAAAADEQQQATLKGASTTVQPMVTLPHRPPHALPGLPPPHQQLLPAALQPLLSLQAILEQCHDYQKLLVQDKKSNDNATTRHYDDDAMEEEAMVLQQEQEQVEEQQQTAVALFRDEFDHAVQTDLVSLLQLVKNASSSSQQANNSGAASTTTTTSHEQEAQPETANPSSATVPSPEILLFRLEQWLVGLHRWRMNLKMPTSTKFSLIQPAYQQVFEAYVALRKHQHSKKSHDAKSRRHATAAASGGDDQDKDEDQQHERDDDEEEEEEERDEEDVHQESNKDHDDELLEEEDGEEDTKPAASNNKSAKATGPNKNSQAVVMV
jgi:hypothetical protein